MKNIDFGIVADIYDNYVNVDFDIPFYKSLCKNYNGGVLELMCGTGRVSQPLLEDGIDVTCVDYSQEMLDVFSRKLTGRKASLICQDVSKLDLGRKFEFIFIPFHSFSEIIDRETRRQAMGRIIEHLEEDGDLLITLYNPVYRLKLADGSMKLLGKYELPHDRTLVVTYYNTLGTISNLVCGMQFYEIYNDKNELMEKRFLDIAFSLVSKDEIVDLCNEFGLSIKKVYGDYNFGEFNEKSRFMNYVLTRQRHS
ncbi:MAG TPA: class I SAM-dependent methyltransferase [Syntrophomonadaceae bacterium]|nr:class I SAM-dependent methyltransferase [Syntrophomonadaceae bacterium]